MTALLTFFRANPILSLVAAAAIFGWTAMGVQTWRINGLQERVGRLHAEIDECVRANESNQTTIDALVTAAEHNAARYEAEIERADEATERADELASRLEARADDDIDAIERAGADVDCAAEPLPDAIRVRLDPRGHRDADGRSSGGTPGSGPGAADAPSDGS